MGALGLVAAMAVTGGRQWPPAPRIHDEFSYLLAGDTFARGRFANPTPAHWQHFESYHILLRPHYASKYPPAQGVVLAAGQRLAGQPIAGVWLSAGLLVAAVTWALLGWFGAPVAAVGGLLALVIICGAGNPYGYAYWVSGFWGGNVAATGGALVLGAARRLTRQPAARDSVLLGLGLVVLACSRPFEGLLMAAPCALAVAWSTRRRLRVLVPATAVVLAGGSLLATYNARVTGDPLTMPYLAYERQYSNLPLFAFGPARLDRQLTTTNEAMRRFDEEAPQSAHFASWPQWLGVLARRALMFRQYYLPGLAAILLAAGLAALRGADAGMALASLGALAAGAASTTWFAPHYVAPVLAPLVLLMTLGAEQLSRWRPAMRPIGAGVAWGIVALAATLALVDARHLRKAELYSWWVRRESLDQRLRAQGGQHLVFVSYGPRHLGHDEWVYNGADLAGTPVLWARSLGPTADAALARDFPARRVWRLHVDDRFARPELEPAPALATRP